MAMLPPISHQLSVAAGGVGVGVSGMEIGMSSAFSLMFVTSTRIPTLSPSAISTGVTGTLFVVMTVSGVVGSPASMVNVPDRPAIVTVWLPVTSQYKENGTVMLSPASKQAHFICLEV